MCISINNEFVVYYLKIIRITTNTNIVSNKCI